MDVFPIEIITIILSNLPVQSVIKCRSVSKTWLSIIDNPNFPQLHFNSSSSKSKSKSGNNNNTNLSSSLLFLPNSFDEIYIAKQETDHIKSSNIVLTTTEINISCKRSTCNLSEPSVNGLLFIYSTAHYDHLTENGNNCLMYVCNPATRDCVRLPNFNHIHCNQATLLRGFGVDSVSKKFKVVQMATYVGGRSSNPNDMKSEVQVYTVGENVWRNVGKGPDDRFSKVLSAFVNGSSHWLAVREPYGNGIDIVSFNLSSEEFGVVPTPEFGFLAKSENEFSVPEPAYFEVFALGECLSVVDFSFEHHVEIWVMRDYNVKESWMKYSVTKHYMDKAPFIIQPIAFLNKSEIVLLHGSSKLVSYNFDSKRFTPIDIYGLRGYSFQYGFPPNFYRVYPYVESLFSLKIRN